MFTETNNTMNNYFLKVSQNGNSKIALSINYQQLKSNSTIQS